MPLLLFLVTFGTPEAGLLIHVDAALAGGATPRNRARYHPQGAPPQYGRKSVRGSRDLDKIRGFVFGDDANDDDSASASVLIDGNNVRNFAGSHRLGAIDLTRAVSRWRDRCCRCGGGGGSDPNRNYWPPKVCVVWDGGRGPSASPVGDSHSSGEGEGGEWTAAPAVSAAFSGPDCSADDVIVQVCCFLDGLRRVSRVAVFTSDTNLGQRCQLQCRDADVRVFHSTYLAWLLEESHSIQGYGSFGDSSSTSARHLTEPDCWEREERREQVRELQSFLESEKMVGTEEGSALTSMDAISTWINKGQPGLSVGRVTKIGSIMYAIDKELN